MNNKFIQLLFMIFLYSVSANLAIEDKNGGCVAFEREALIKFKEMLVDPSNLLSSWTGENCCGWKGISCSSETGHVIKINLRNNACRNVGLLMIQNSSCIGGQISSSLLDLKYLSYLDLSLNDFQTSIPEFFGSLEKLTYLNLSRAGFTGMVPPHLGNLSNLQYLDLSNFLYIDLNSLWVSDMFWISRLTSLEYLNMGNLNLSLAAPHWLQALNFLPSLSEMHLPFCYLQSLRQSLPSVNFTHLSVIELTGNGFNSSIPQWLSNLSNLVTLDLSFNDVKGNISELVGDLSKCCSNSLEQLLLVQNQISGQLPYSLALLKQLRGLFLAVNSIFGSIPTSVGNLTNLEYFDVSYNFMNGSIPESIKKLANLEDLNLLQNNWQGILSQNQLKGLKKLKSLSLSSKDRNFILNLSDDWVPPFSLTYIRIQNCGLGPKFPAWIKAQKQLSTIVLLDVGISDFLSDWIWSFPSRLKWCDFSYNEIRGMLPQSSINGSLPYWHNASYLNLAGNLLSGPIPPNIGQAMLSVVYLNLSGNSLSGPIPYSIGKLKNLYSLDLSKNKLSGEIDRGYWRNLENLSILDLSMNSLSGSIPKSIFSLHQLKVLKLSENNLSGDLSLFPVKNRSWLSLLDLGGNQFSGKIPKWIGESLLLLSELRLRNNMFTGNIPDQLCNAIFLHILDIAFNNLSGSIPECLGNLTGLHRVYPYMPPSPLLPYNYISEMKLVMKGRETVYTKVLKIVNILDFSNNNSIGEIPKGITKLFPLGTLNLSRNQLTGHIPEDIGSLRILETLDLSCNHLSGPIPPSMTSMTFLNHLNLSNNNLSGTIPSSNQFLTFNDPSIYEGNRELCGSPLPECLEPREDNGTLTDDHCDEDTEDSEKFGFFMSMLLGFAFGFCAVFSSWLVYRPWRVAYFHHVDNLINCLDITFALKMAHLGRMLERMRMED